MNSKLSFLFLVFVLLFSPTAIASNHDNLPVGNPMEHYGFEFLSALDLGQAGHLLTVAANGDKTVVGGYINNDVVQGGENIPVVVICTDSNFLPNVVHGTYSDTSFNCGNDGLLFVINEDGTIDWGTYFGGSDNDRFNALTSDNDNNIIAVGEAGIGAITNAVFDSTVDSIADGFILKLDIEGRRLWSTYIGGSGYDTARDVVVDSQNNIIVSGLTKSDDFPLNNAIDDTYNDTSITGGEMFISKFDENGTNLWSTYIGGTEFESDYSISLDSEDNVFVSGLTRSNDFPFVETQQNNSGQIDVFLLKLSPEGELLNANLLGGFLSDVIFESEVDNSGNLIMLGYTTSSDFPIVNGFDDTLNSESTSSVYTDGIIVKLDSNTEIIWSTYLGGSGADKALNLHINENDEIIVVGTTSSIDFPYYVPYDIDSGINDLQVYDRGDQPSDVFSAIFTSEGQLAYSFYFGGISNDYVYGSDFIDGEVVLVGNSRSGQSFPYTNSTTGMTGKDYIGRFDIPANYSNQPPVATYNELFKITDEENNDGGIISRISQISQNSSDSEIFILATIILIILVNPIKKIVLKIHHWVVKDHVRQKQEEYRQYFDKLTNFDQE